MSFKAKNKAKFALQIYEYPASLKLLVNYFCWCGFSFSAANFVSQANEKKVEKIINPILPNLKQKKPLTRITCKKVCTLACNLTFIAFNLYQFWILYDSFDLFNGTVTKSVPSYAEGFETYFNSFNDFKPILGMTQRGFLYIFLIDYNINYIFNLYSGGRMIYALSRISTITTAAGRTRPRSDDRSLAWRIIGYKMVALLLIFGCGIILFQCNVSSVSSSKQYLIIMTLSSQLMQNICISIVPTFFIYAMIEYRRAIRSIFETKNFAKIASHQCDEMQNSAAIDHELYVVGDHLTALGAHFRETISYMQFPLTIANLTNVYFIISGCCFLLIIDEQNRAIGFSAFLFNNAAFGFCRMIAICAAGNLATGAVDELIIELYRHVVATSRWTVNRWTRFDEIKRLRSKFRPTLFGLFAVRQSTIFACLAFALNYIVILLQTETYGKK